MIKLGIISLDHPHSTGNHIPALKYLKNKICVAGVYSENSSIAQTIIDEFNCRYYSNRDELLSEREIDAVLITSINANHASDSIAALLSGKDVLCDKPIAITIEDAVSIHRTVLSTEQKFITTFPVRFNPSIQKVKKLLEEGYFGEIKGIMATNHGCMYEPGVPQWVTKSEKNGGGCLIDHCVHVADIIRWITNQEFQTIKVESQNSLRSYIDSEDIAVLHGKLNNGCIYQIDASWSRKKDDYMWGDVTFRIVGTKASASLDIYNNQYIEIHSNGNLTPLFPNNIVQEHGEIFLNYFDYKINKKPMVNATSLDGLRTIELAYTGYQSIKSGKTENIILNNF